MVVYDGGWTVVGGVSCLEEEREEGESLEREGMLRVDFLGLYVFYLFDFSINIFFN
ncbi:hypothetical protein Hanom_Chr11g00989351 [Helianthus anomalus]